MIKQLITIKILSEIDEEIANKAGNFASKLLTKKADAVAENPNLKSSKLQDMNKPFNPPKTQDFEKRSMWNPKRYIQGKYTDTIEKPKVEDSAWSTAGKLGAGAAAGAGVLAIHRKIKEGQDKAHQESMEREMQSGY